MKNSILNPAARSALIFPLLLCLFISNINAQDTWTQKSDLGYNVSNVIEPAARSSAVGFSIGNKGYLGTGFPNYRKDFWEYDPGTDTWTQKADFGGNGRASAVGFSIGNKGYLGTGYYTDGTSSYYTKDFWEYDPDGNTWTEKASFGGTARAGAVGFSIGNKGYLGTGNYYDGISSSYYKDFWEYDSGTDTWTQKANFGGTKRASAVGFGIGNKGYLGTGYYYDGTYNSYEDFWEYDPDGNIWTEKSSFGGGARADAVGFSIGSKGYLGTGYDDVTSNYTKDFWEYDPDLNVWTQKADFWIWSGNAVGFSIGNKGYLGTGSIKGFWGPGPVLKGFWEFDPENNSWMHKADFGENVCHGAVGFSIGSKGYLGTGGDDVLKKDFWEYDPASNTWTQKADFGGIGRDNAVGFSIGNKGYLGTGSYKDQISYNYFPNDFWEYDPDLNVWTQKADFGGTARDNAVGFSIGSKGYLGTGGYHDSWSDLYYKDFWEYDPELNVWTQKADFGGTARDNAVGFSIGTKGYVGTGHYNFKDDFWEYDPEANTWTQKADFGGTGRHNAVGFSIGSKGYLGTGEDDVFKKDFWEYDPVTDIWTQRADFGGEARSQALGFSIVGKGYLGTGLLYDGTSDYSVKDFWEYTPLATGINQPATANPISIYSNPASDFIIFVLGNVAPMQTEIFIYNTSGVLLKQFSASHSTQLQIPVDDIGSDGMYFYRVSTNDQQFFAGKFVIQH